MSLFQPAEVTSAYLKMGLMGFQGSGKTRTGTDTAVGLIEMLRQREMPLADKPLFFLDTEKGSDWVKKRIEAAGIKLFTAKTRAFSDLLAAMKEAEASSSLLLIDSVTHFWVELGAAYAKKQNRNRLYFEDWAYLKGEWRKFTDAFVNSPLHTIICGRAGYEYDYFENDAGKKELEKTNIKMKAEGEMGYEPDLLVLMERDTDMDTKQVSHVATVMKDRGDVLDGKSFVNPTFKSFLPHIQLLNLGGRQMGIDVSRTSEHMIVPDKKDWNPVQRRIAVDEIQTLLVVHFPGQAAKDKQRKVELIRKHFDNKSWTEIEEVMPLFDLRAGFESLHQELEGKPSRYGRAAQAAEPIAAATREPIDELPDHSSPPIADVKAEPVPDQMVADGLPPGLRRTAEPPKEPTLEERLLSDIPHLATAQDCLMWGLTMSSQTAGLPTTAQCKITDALMARQRAVMNGASACA